MNRILLLLILSSLGKNLAAQYVYTIKADSVKITNSCDTAELIVENHTQNVPGFLFNKGRGRTEFRKGLLKLNDSLYRIGDDTLKIPNPSVITASEGLSMVGNSVQLGDLVLPAFRVRLDNPFVVSQINPSLFNRFTNDRVIHLNSHKLYFYGGTIRLSNGYVGAPDTLLDLRARRGVGLFVNMDSLFPTAKPLVVSFNDRSVFHVKVEGGRAVTEFSDNATGSTYLNIRSNNITPGNAGNPYNYGVRGVITLQGRYQQSDDRYGMIAGIYDTSWHKPIVDFGRIDYCSYFCSPRVNSTPNGIVRGIYYEMAYDWSNSTYYGGNIAFENRNGNVLLNTMGGHAGGRTGIHNYEPTAWLHLGAGINTAYGAPLKFSAGDLLDSPEEGAVEFDGSHFYVTDFSGRYKLSKTLDGQLTTNFGGSSLAAWNSITTSLTVTGAQAGDVVMVSANSGTVNPPSITISGYVTSPNTVTIRAYNGSNSAVTIASDTYKVRVIK
jgi:hypothetical protein